MHILCGQDWLQTNQRRKTPAVRVLKITGKVLREFMANIGNYPKAYFPDYLNLTSLTLFRGEKVVRDGTLKEL